MSILRSPVFIIVATQLLYSLTDLMGRAYMRGSSLSWAMLGSVWFITYFVLRQIAMFGQLYAFSSSELGKTMAIFGAVSIVLSNALGFLLLGELLSRQAYIGVFLAVTAFIILALK